MINNSILTQVVILGLAIGIVVTYIQPKWETIQELKASILQTAEELNNVKAVNEDLNRLYVDVNTINLTDKEALSTYVPEYIDEVKVLKDIYTILQLADVSITTLKYDGESQEKAKLSESLDPKPAIHSFNFEFISSYEEMKLALSLFESNAYPLKIRTLGSSITEEGLLNVSIQVETYSRKSKE